MDSDREIERRRRAAHKQLERMFRDPPEGPLPASSIPNDIDEDRLDAEIDELESELEDILNSSDN